RRRCAVNHICPECGKTMATMGGLEIHTELAHAAPEQSEFVAEAEAEAVDLEDPEPVDVEPVELEPVERAPLDVMPGRVHAPNGASAPQAWPPMPDVAAPGRAYAPVLRGYDPTIPLTALLVLAMLFAGIAAAIGG